MDIMELMRRRHSVRQYRDEPLSDEEIALLNGRISELNAESGLNIQLVTNEKRAFASKIAHYGKFEGVSNYFALVGRKCKELYEKVGYYGEKLVLYSQEIGLHTCWVALNYKKIDGAYEVGEGEKLTMVIAVGHGRHRGLGRRSRSKTEVSNITDSSPEWFSRGVEAALLAPTAMNQQRFYLKDNGDGTVSAKAKLGFYTNCDLGIVKCHFELGAGMDNFKWA